MRLLLHLELRQLANYVTVTLRTPKRLIPAILMAGYFAFILLMQVFSHSMDRPARAPFAVPPIVSDSAGAIVFVLMSLVLIYSTIRAFSETMLTFPLSDIDYLFASPIPRQAILTLKLAGLYVKVGLWGLFMSVFMMPQLWMVVRPTPGAVLVGWIGLMLFAAFVINTSTLINLVATYREGGKWWLSFVVRACAYALTLGVVGAVAFTAWQTGNLAEAVFRTVRHPVIIALLLPAKWGSDLLVCGFTGLRPIMLVEAMGLSVMVLASYLLIMMRPENPYEPSLSASSRIAAIRAAKSAGGVFRLQREQWAKKAKAKDIATGLPAFGRGAMAIVWKNLNVMVRTSGKALVVVPALAAVVLVASKVAMPGKLSASDVANAASFILGYTVFIASMTMLQSFRGDLKQANILKPMPIPAWQIVAAQTVGGALLVAALAWTALILVGVTYGLTRDSLLLLMALSLPAVTYGALTWQAASAIIYPKWEDQTQQFMGGILSMFAAGVSIAPPVIVGVLLKALRVGVIPTALAVILVSAGMAIMGIIASGYLYARFDPTDE